MTVLLKAIKYINRYFYYTRCIENSLISPGKVSPLKIFNKYRRVKKFKRTITNFATLILSELDQRSKYNYDLNLSCPPSQNKETQLFTSKLSMASLPSSSDPLLKIIKYYKIRLQQWIKKSFQKTYNNIKLVVAITLRNNLLFITIPIPTL